MWGKLYGQFIIDGVYEYSYVVSKRPDLKETIDAYLIKEYGNLIIAGKYQYSYVLGNHPDLKTEIDAYLISQGRADLIVV